MAWFKKNLDENEWVEADDGYVGDDPQLIKVPTTTTTTTTTQSCHEAGNNLLRKFSILKNQFEYSLKKHSMFFCACAVLTQLSIELGAMHMFDIADNYNDLNWLHLNLGEGMDEQGDSDNDL